MKKVFERFIGKTIKSLRTEPRLCGLTVGGSWITKEIDEYSDLDLIVVSSDEGYSEVFKERFEIIKALGDLVSAFTGEHVGEPRLLICLFRNPLIHVDVKFVALKDFHIRVEEPWIAWEKENKLTKALQRSAPKSLKSDPQWIEDRFWTWIHYGAVKLGRGEIFETIGFLGFLREQVLAPLAMSNQGKTPRGVRKIEQYLPDFAKRLQKTVPSYSRQSCIKALKETIKLYQELRGTAQPGSLAIRDSAETESLRYFSKIAKSLQKRSA
jgi:predicted nucleotidyltransferase